MRRVLVVFGAHSEAAEAGIETARLEQGVFQQGGAIAGGVDQQLAAQVLGLCVRCAHADAAHHAVFHQRRLYLCCQTNPRSGLNRAPGQILKRAAHIQNAQMRNGILENRRIAGRHKADPRDRMVQPGRDSQGFHLVDEAASAGADGGADLVILFQYRHGVARARQRLGG